MRKRNGMKPIYVGDVGDIQSLNTPRQLPEYEISDLDNMDIHELFALALECGIKVQQLIGINRCYENSNMLLLKGVLPQGFTLIEDTKYCNNCFCFFRVKSKVFI